MRDPTPVVRSLAGLRDPENACTRCPLYRDATQAVPGEGGAKAPLMIVGEQPGDREDVAGHPFVGPAGGVLDRALADAGIDRSKAFVTNAVKHFKHEMRGKRRLHKKPNASEIDACRWWLDLERSLLKPRVVLALGATAVKGLTGRTAAIKTLRGHPTSLDDGTPLVVTVHPSYLLRIREATDRHEEYERFVTDLRQAAALLRQARSLSRVVA